MKRLFALASIVLVATAAVAGGIAGQVVDGSNGNPIADAAVIARSNNGEAGRARTNDRGMYLIEDLEPGRYQVSAQARGYEPGEYPGAVAVRQNEITRDIDTRLRPTQQPDPGAITGRVIDRRTGEPIRGAVVVAASADCRRKARTDERGHYLIRGLKPGTYQLKAAARHYVREPFPRPVPVRSGQTAENVNFALQPKPRRGGIAGRVLEARTNQPIAGATVVAQCEFGGGRAVTDRRGYYYIARLAPGRYEVSAMKRGYRTETFPRPVPVHPHEVTRDIDFYLHATRAESD